MKCTIGLLIAGVMGVGCATDKSDPTSIEAGAQAQAQGIARYIVEKTANTSAIHLLAPSGDEIGQLAVAVDPQSVPREDEPDNIFVQTGFAHRYSVSYTADGSTTQILTGRTDSIKHFSSTTGWRVALADPALAQSFPDAGVRFRVGKPAGYVSRSQLNDAPYTGEYPCGYGNHGEGFRTPQDPHVGGSWPFWGCGGQYQGGTYWILFPMWIPYDNPCGHGEQSFWEHGANRYCDGSCCNNNDCTSDSGNAPCAPTYGPSGCYTDPTHWDYEQGC